MKIRIRTTNRKDLPHSNIAISLSNEKKTDGTLYPLFTQIKLEKKLSGFDDEDIIKLRVKQNKILETLDCGTILSPIIPHPKALEKMTDEFASINITAMIVDPQNNVIKASFKKPLKHNLNEQIDNKAPLIFNKQHTEPLLWRLELSESDTPVIYLSDKIDSREKIKQDKVWLSSILPEVIRRIFLFIRSESLWENDDEWILTWKKLVDNYNKSECKWPEEGNIDESAVDDEWIDAFIDEFMQVNLANLYNSALAQLNTEEE